MDKAGRCTVTEHNTPLTAWLLRRLCLTVRPWHPLAADRHKLGLPVLTMFWDVPRYLHGGTRAVCHCLSAIDLRSQQRGAPQHSLTGLPENSESRQRFQVASTCNAKKLMSRDAVTVLNAGALCFQSSENPDRAIGRVPLDLRSLEQVPTTVLACAAKAAKTGNQGTLPPIARDLRKNYEATCDFKNAVAMHTPYRIQ